MRGDSLKTTVIIILGLFIFSGCTHIAHIETEPYDYSDIRTYQANFDDTWSAVIKAIEWYPIITIEKDSGILLTDWAGDTSPNHFFVKKSFGEPDSTFGIGIKVQEVKISGLMVAYVLENSPADIYGMQPGDYILSVDSSEVNTLAEFVNKINSESTKRLEVKRERTGDIEIISIKPILVYDILREVPALYRFNIRVSSINEQTTEVRVINHEKAMIGNTSYNYYFVRSAHVREKKVLDRIEIELLKRSALN